MTPCDFNQEDFCIFQAEYPEVEKCSFAKGKLQRCTIKESDLIELCSDCGEPTTECDCGTCWVMVTDKHGKIVAVTPKDLAKLREKENKKKEP
jgi:recombinational DNA repair protein RecR